MNAFAIAGIAAIAAGIIITIAAAIRLALRIARVRQRIAALPSHPFLETEWRERQTLIVRNLTTNLHELRAEFEALGASVARIAVAIQALDRTRRLAAAATEEMLSVGVPWLRGLFARR